MSDAGGVGPLILPSFVDIFEADPVVEASALGALAARFQSVPGRLPVPPTAASWTWRGWPRSQYGSASRTSSTPSTSAAAGSPPGPFLRRRVGQPAGSAAGSPERAALVDPVGMGGAPVGAYLVLVRLGQKRVGPARHVHWHALGEQLYPELRAGQGKLPSPGRDALGSEDP
jgi:hypothetical protein